MATDGTHAAATLVFDLRQRAWATDLQEAVGLSPDLFPPVRPSAEPVGELRASIARRVGLPAGVPVILGGADSQACALGAGVVAEGPVSEMAGSSTCLNAAVPRTVADPAGHALSARRAGAVHDGDRDQHDRRGRGLGGGPALRPAWTPGRARPTTNGSIARRPLCPAGADGVLALPSPGRWRTDRSGPARRRSRDSRCATAAA